MDETSLTPLPDARRRRLLFRATHRGTRENDLLIGGFVAERLPLFSEAEVAGLEMIMDIPDPLIGDFLTGRGPMPDGGDTALLAAMRAAALARMPPA